jgi:hypothetical protein
MKKVEALFERARTDALSPDEMEKLWRSVATAGPGGGSGFEGPSGSGGGAFGAAKVGGLLKAGALLAMVGGLVAGAVALHGADRAAPAVPTGVVAAPRPVEAPAAPEASAPAVAWDDLPRASGEARATEPRSEPAPARRAHPRSEPAAQAPAVALAPSAPPAPAPAADAPAEDTASQPSEGALLLQARRHLTSDPAGTLSLADDAARRFPSGPLAPEREVLAIEALTKLGRSGDARARLAAFRARYPQSPHLARLEALIGP